jgi:hypothetical protein
VVWTNITLCGCGNASLNCILLIYGSCWLHSKIEYFTGKSVSFKFLELSVSCIFVSSCQRETSLFLITTDFFDDCLPVSYLKGHCKFFQYVCDMSLLLIMNTRVKFGLQSVGF